MTSSKTNRKTIADYETIADYYIEQFPLEMAAAESVNDTVETLHAALIDSLANSNTLPSDDLIKERISGLAESLGEPVDSLEKIFDGKGDLEIRTLAKILRELGHTIKISSCSLKKAQRSSYKNEYHITLLDKQDGSYSEAKLLTDKENVNQVELCSPRANEAKYSACL
ncbi:hypothetical protein ACUH88_07680 [Dermabacteraceae bacterium P13095]